MKLSARNQLEGKVTGVELGAVMANVKIEISEPNVITAVITKESAEKLGLAEGDDVTAIIGHTPTVYLEDDGESPFHIVHRPKQRFIAIDCGCGNKTPRRRLACLRLDDMKEYYV